ncbi:MAG TPA: hypothetical protein PKI19_06645 [Elusimicrobiales bacterium]|nr:hypothetical protein [Elusimicrobiales bacterium]
MSNFFLILPLLLVLPVASAAYYSTSMGILALLEILSLLPLPLVIFLLLRLLAGTLRGRRPPLIKPAITMAAWGAIYFVLSHAPDYRAGRMQTNLKPLMGAIEQYKADTGAYPESLEQLPDKYINPLPACEFDSRTPYYVKNSNGLGFAVICSRPSSWGSSRYICESSGACRVFTGF